MSCYKHTVRVSLQAPVLAGLLLSLLRLLPSGR